MKLIHPRELATGRYVPFMRSGRAYHRLGQLSLPVYVSSGICPADMGFLYTHPWALQLVEQLYEVLDGDTNHMAGMMVDQLAIEPSWTRFVTRLHIAPPQEAVELVEAAMTIGRLGGWDALLGFLARGADRREDV